MPCCTLGSGRKKRLLKTVATATDAVSAAYAIPDIEVSLNAKARTNAPGTCQRGPVRAFHLHNRATLLPDSNSAQPHHSRVEHAEVDSVERLAKVLVNRRGVDGERACDCRRYFRVSGTARACRATRNTEGVANG